MGIIEKQATRNVIYSYFGIILGFITVMVSSHILKPEENGLTRILISLASLFTQFASLGFAPITARLFPFFRNKEKKHHGFLFYGIATCLIGFVLFCIGFFIFKDTIIEHNEEKSRLFADNLYYLIPLTFFSLFFALFDSYLRASYISVIGSSSKDFTQRILILFCLFLYFFHLINFSTFLLLYFISTCIPTLILLYYIVKFDEWHIKPVKGFISRDLRNEMFRLGFFSLITGGTGLLIANIDMLMVNQKLGLAEAGIYTIAFYFGSIITVPAKSLYRITSGVVAENFKSNDLNNIHQLYIKSCNSQLTIGLILFIGIWVNLDNIMHLLPQEYSSGKYVILFVSAGYLLDMATGINGIILAISKYYWYDTVFTFIIIFITVACNYVLIPIYGITGSAIATAITIGCYNVFRAFALYFKFGMQPYNFNIVKLLIISIVAFLPGYFMPELNNLILDILIRSAAVGILFLILILKTNASPDLINTMRKGLGYLGFK